MFNNCYIAYDAKNKNLILREVGYVKNSYKKYKLYTNYLTKKIKNPYNPYNLKLTDRDLEQIKKIVGKKMLNIGQKICLEVNRTSKHKKILIFKKVLFNDKHLGEVFMTYRYCIRSGFLIY